MANVRSRNINNIYFISKWMSFKILNFISKDTKQTFRKLEDSFEKMTKRKLDIVFNQNCLQHGLLPNYTNIKLHDEAARKEEFVLKFRQSLVQRQIDKIEEDLKPIKRKFIEAFI